VRAARTGIVLLLAAALAGCGSSDDETGLTNGEAQALVAQLEAARANAAARDAEGTKVALVRFRRSVARLQREGALSADTARALRIGAQRVVKRVVSDNAPPAQPVPAGPPATSTSTIPAPPGKQEKHKKKHDKGKGKKHGDKEGAE
jgi:hypothetical protein